MCRKPFQQQVIRPAGSMARAFDYGSKGSRFDSWVGRFLVFKGILTSKVPGTLLFCSMPLILSISKVMASALGILALEMMSETGGMMNNSFRSFPGRAKYKTKEQETKCEKRSQTSDEKESEANQSKSNLTRRPNLLPLPNHHVFSTALKKPQFECNPNRVLQTPDRSLTLVSKRDLDPSPCPLL
jgi:hypothetical protein